MSKELPNIHHHTELMTREHAGALAEAANELGGVTVRALANEGERYITDDGYRSTVPEGKIQVAVSSGVSTDDHYKRTKEIMDKREAA